MLDADCLKQTQSKTVQFQKSQYNLYEFDLFNFVHERSKCPLEIALRAILIYKCSEKPLTLSELRVFQERGMHYSSDETLTAKYLLTLNHYVVISCLWALNKIVMGLFSRYVPVW